MVLRAPRADVRVLGGEDPGVAPADVRALDIGPEPSPGRAQLTEPAVAAVVAGSLVAFGNTDPAGEGQIGDQHRIDALQSLLLAQLAANAAAERHKDPARWYQSYRGTLEQVAWVIESDVSATRYLPQTSTYTAATVVSDAFRRRVLPDELAVVTTALEAFRADNGGISQLVFECPSHAGGIGNFQFVLITEEDATLTMRIAQVSFTAPQHVTRLFGEQFTGSARFQVGFLTMTLNEQVFAGLRGVITTKLGSRFAAAVAQLPPHR